MDYSHGVARVTGLSDFDSHPVIGGAEKASKVKGSIATWGCQRVGRKGGQRWRKKGGRLRITREDGEKASCRGTNGRERLDGSQGRSREEDRHSRRAEGKK